jgi:hypothetical protein
MGGANTAEQVRQQILRLCYAGLDSWALRTEAFHCLQRAVPYAAYWCATTDPETLLYTSAVMEGIAHAAIPAFINNELLGDDANKFTELAKSKSPVSTLYTAARGELRRSQRFREILEPVGQGNELRAVLRTGKSVWGGVCLHRELHAPDFNPAEVAFLRQITPHLAVGLRTAALLSTMDGDGVAVAPVSSSPGLLMLADDLTVTALTPAGEWWLAEIGDWPRYASELGVAPHAWSPEG